MSPDYKIEALEPARRVLLVEDDVMLRGLLAEAMRDSGLSVIEVENADEAQRYLLAAAEPDLVFSDVEMPGSLNGIELGKWIRQTFPEIGLILTSGTAVSGAAEVGHFIPKPYGLFAAATAAREMVDVKRGER